MTTINSRPSLNGNTPKDYAEAAGILLDAAATVEAALRAMSEILHGRNYQTIVEDFFINPTKDQQANAPAIAREQDYELVHSTLDHESIRRLALAIHRQSEV